MKRNRKTVFALLLALAMTLGLAAAVWATEGGGTAGGDGIVVGPVGPGNYPTLTELEIPFTKTVKLGGNTGPGDLVPLCAFHHRLKTHTGWLSDLLPDGTVYWRHPAGGEWVVDPGTDPFPGIDTLIWDVRHQSANPKPVGGLTGHTEERNQQRQRQREHHRAIRSERDQRLGIPEEPPY